MHGTTVQNIILQLSNSLIHFNGLFDEAEITESRAAWPGFVFGVRGFLSGPRAVETNTSPAQAVFSSAENDNLNGGNMEYKEAFEQAAALEEEKACGHTALIARALYREMRAGVTTDRSAALEEAAKLAALAIADGGNLADAIRALQQQPAAELDSPIDRLPRAVFGQGFTIMGKLMNCLTQAEELKEPATVKPLIFEAMNLAGELTIAARACGYQPPDQHSTSKGWHPQAGDFSRDHATSWKPVDPASVAMLQAATPAGVVSQAAPQVTAEQIKSTIKELDDCEAFDDNGVTSSAIAIVRKMFDAVPTVDVDREYAAAHSYALSAPPAAETPVAWTDDQMIRFASMILIQGNRPESIEMRLQTFRDHEALRGNSRPEAKPVAAGIPGEVLVALDRMCKPLHETILSGATAESDAYCMKIIRDHMLAAAPQEQAPVDKDAKTPVFYLNLKQLRMALDIFDPGPEADADDMDTEIAIQAGDGHSGKGLYAWSADYPAEGAFALFDTPEEADEQTQPQQATNLTPAVGESGEAK